jgi:hypothetical protein
MQFCTCGGAATRVCLRAAHPARGRRVCNGATSTPIPSRRSPAATALARTLVVLGYQHSHRMFAASRAQGMSASRQFTGSQVAGDSQVTFPVPVMSGVAEFRTALLGEGARALPRVFAGENGTAHLGLDRGRVVFRHSLGLRHRGLDRPNGDRAVRGDQRGDLERPGAHLPVGPDMADEPGRQCFGRADVPPGQQQGCFAIRTGPLATRPFEEYLSRTGGGFSCDPSASSERVVTDFRVRRMACPAVARSGVVTDRLRLWSWSGQAEGRSHYLDYACGSGARGSVVREDDDLIAEFMRELFLPVSACFR